MERLAHIADLHLSVDEPVAHGIDLWNHLERVLAALDGENVSLVVVGGDIALHKGDLPTYRRTAEVLNAFGCDYIVQPGNHDTPELFEDAFGRRYRWTGRPLDIAATWSNHLLLFLDSSAGRITPDQLAWFQSAWIAGGASALFVHHPVTAGICRYMEANFELEERETVCRRLSVAGQVPVFSGHYHVAYVGSEGTVRQYVTPAVFYQLDPESVEFAVANPSPGYRIVEFDNGSVTSFETIIDPGSVRGQR